ncbi:PepSY domain-containing protein [Shinella sp.]|uniref:PepSY domain-containing protein n=1 Tax=Shinella sp. TaxID=1870904 RepID=UPI0025851046|nr:PepSY domain-containing protein [Shinella sp.]MCW5708554.1 PepSY domain-containing protein [Shinella sp.]
MRLITTGLLAAGLLALTVPALAETAVAPVRKTLEQVATELSAKGYVIREIEMDDSHFEAKIVDTKNVVSEAKIDSYTGEILRLERED